MDIKVSYSQHLRATARLIRRSTLNDIFTYLLDEHLMQLHKGVKYPVVKISYSNIDIEAGVNRRYVAGSLEELEKLGLIKLDGMDCRVQTSYLWNVVKLLHEKPTFEEKQKVCEAFRNSDMEKLRIYGLSVAKDGDENLRELHGALGANEMESSGQMLHLSHPKSDECDKCNIPNSKLGQLSHSDNKSECSCDNCNTSGSQLLHLSQSKAGKCDKCNTSNPQMLHLSHQNNESEPQCDKCNNQLLQLSHSDLKSESDCYNCHIWMPKTLSALAEIGTNVTPKAQFLAENVTNVTGQEARALFIEAVELMYGTEYGTNFGALDELLAKLVKMSEKLVKKECDKCNTNCYNCHIQLLHLSHQLLQLSHSAVTNVTTVNNSNCKKRINGSYGSDGTEGTEEEKGWLNQEMENGKEEELSGYLYEEGLGFNEEINEEEVEAEVEAEEEAEFYKESKANSQVEEDIFQPLEIIELKPMPLVNEMAKEITLRRKRESFAKFSVKEVNEITEDLMNCLDSPAKIFINRLWSILTEGCAEEDEQGEELQTIDIEGIAIGSNFVKGSIREAYEETISLIKDKRLTPDDPELEVTDKEFSEDDIKLVMCWKEHEGKQGRKYYIATKKEFYNPEVEAEKEPEPCFLRSSRRTPEQRAERTSDLQYLQKLMIIGYGEEGFQKLTPIEQAVCDFCYDYFDVDPDTCSLLQPKKMELGPMKVDKIKIALRKFGFNMDTLAKVFTQDFYKRDILRMAMHMFSERKMNKFNAENEWESIVSGSDYDELLRDFQGEPEDLVG